MTVEWSIHFNPAPGSTAPAPFLLVTAVGVALFWLALCVSMAYFVAQYFVCIDGCKGGTPPFLLLAVSTFFGLIPGLGTGAIGYFVVKGLWDDAHRPD